MTLLQATFDSASKVSDAVAALRSLDAELEGRIEVRSPYPLTDELGALGVPQGRIRKRIVLIAALCGGLLGGVTAYSVGALTALDYPLPTGGMEIVAGPPLGIVTYEGTALGLILATVGAVLFEARLFRRVARGPLDEQLAAGQILLNVDAAGEDVDPIRAKLIEAGATATGVAD